MKNPPKRSWTFQFPVYPEGLVEFVGKKVPIIKKRGHPV